MHGLIISFFYRVAVGGYGSSQLSGDSFYRFIFAVVLYNHVVLPALCNEFISTVKGTSLASVFFVGELMTSFKTVQSATFLALQSLTIVGIIYFVLNFVLSRLLGVLERRLTVSD